MRCESCCKFVALEFQEPEIVETSVDTVSDTEGSLTGTVRVYRTCAECSQDMKESNFDINEDFEIPAGHAGDGHDLSIEDEEATGHEEGGGRYKKSFFGYEYSATIKCSCGEEIAKITTTDKVAASHMDELQ